MLTLLLSIAVAFAETPGLKVQLEGVKDNQKGQILCALFRAEAGFPMQHNRALEIQQASKVSEHWQCEFANLHKGWYAVSVVHDKNNDGKMNTNSLGIPQEGWATSNNVNPGIRPPNFKESRVQFDGAEKQLLLKMHY
jgi:uncharacterized protein (DUF2141 family)